MRRNQRKDDTHYREKLEDKILKQQDKNKI